MCSLLVYNYYLSRLDDDAEDSDGLCSVRTVALYARYV